MRLKALEPDSRLPTIIHHVMVLALPISMLVMVGMSIESIFRQTTAIGVLQWLLLAPAVFLLIVCPVAAAFVMCLLRWVRGKWRNRSLLSFRIALYLVFSAVVCVLLFFQPYDPLPSKLSMYIVFGVFGFLVLFKNRFASILPPRVYRTADLVLFNLCLAVLLGEAGLRLLASYMPSPLLVTPSDAVQTVLENQRFSPGDIRFGFPFNSTGHYDSEFHSKKEGEFLVVSIGDSFSPGSVPHYFHFTTVCERTLPGISVYNMGFPRLGPCAYLQLMLIEALPLNPDVVVINVFIGNDIKNSERRRESFLDLSYLFDHRNILLFQIPERIIKMTVENRKLGRRPGAHEDEDARFPVEATSPEYLYEQFPWLKDPLLEKPPFSRETFMKIEKNRASTVCWNNESLYAKFYAAMSDIKKAAGDVPLVVVLIPDEFQVEDLLWEEMSKDMDVSSLNRYHPQKAIVTWLEERDIPCLDLLPALRAVPPLEDGRRHLYHIRDTHFNARGNAIAGQCLSDFLVSKGLAPKGIKSQ